MHAYMHVVYAWFCRGTEKYVPTHMHICMSTTYTHTHTHIHTYPCIYLCIHACIPVLFAEKWELLKLLRPPEQKKSMNGFVHTYAHAHIHTCYICVNLRRTTEPWELPTLLRPCEYMHSSKHIYIYIYIYIYTHTHMHTCV